MPNGSFSAASASRPGFEHPDLEGSRRARRGQAMSRDVVSRESSKPRKIDSYVTLRATLMYFGAQAVAAAARASANARAVTEEMRVIMASACDPIWRLNTESTCTRRACGLRRASRLRCRSHLSRPHPRALGRATRRLGGALSGVTARGHFLSPRTYLIITESNRALD